MEVKETMLVTVICERMNGELEIFRQDCEELKHAVRYVLGFQAKRGSTVVKYEIENCPLLK